MSDAKDTLLRQLALPDPREPRTFLEKIREQEFSVSQRTLQRDLVNTCPEPLPFNATPSIWKPLELYA